MYKDPVVEYYKQFVDLTLIRENLKLTVEQRLINLQRVVEDLEKLQKAGQRLREQENKVQR